jgi:excisionase family DNA binding protein
VQELAKEHVVNDRLLDALEVADRLLTTRQVAEFLGLSPETVLRRYRAGELLGYRLGSNVLRFRESDVEAFLEARRAA